MGQYFYIVNLDKKEYLYPHKLGSGLKFYEIISTKVPQILVYLLRQSTDPSSAGEIKANAGRWAGDRITVVGDYDTSQLYNKAQDEFLDISDIIRKELESIETEAQYGTWDLGESWCK